MKNIYLYPLFFSLLFIENTLQSQSLLHANFTKNPIVIDGKTDEWEDPFHFFDASSGFLYSICNDSNNLYVAFRSMEQSTQMRFVELGMLLQVTIKGKKTYPLNIEFPFNVKDKKNVFRASAENAQVMPKFFSFNEQEKQYALSYDKKEKQIYSMDSGTIAIRVFWDNKKVMTIEMAIPFKDIFRTPDFNLSGIKSCLMKMTLNSFDRATQKSSGPSSGPTDYGDMDNISRSGNGGKVFGNDKVNFRQQYEQFAASEISNNRKMYNKAEFSQPIQLASAPEQ